MTNKPTLPSQKIIFLYGPPGSGKSVLGRRIAELLELPFIDLDLEIERRLGLSIPRIFEQAGETGFRKQEKEALQAAIRRGMSVIALGGGALLDPESRNLAEIAGQIVCLTADFETLYERLARDKNPRPLLVGSIPAEQPGSLESIRENLAALLQQRSEHYNSFQCQISIQARNPEDLAWQVLSVVGRFRIHGMGQAYDAMVIPSGLVSVGLLASERELKGPAVLVSDLNIAPLYAPTVLNSLEQSGYRTTLISLTPGENNKTMETVSCLLDSFLEAGIERRSTVIALGGGVVSDLAGFAAAIFLRGVPWAVLPTSLLGMADASLGGKTGADLPQGKNLVGAFHPPRFVLSDPDVLDSLPEAEMRSGIAEVVKAGIIGDPELFAYCALGWDFIRSNWVQIVSRAIAVKARIIQEDPYEIGSRAILNLGHTFGHALELASGYRLRHGEAISIGLVLEARLAGEIGIPDANLPREISSVLKNLGLPVEVPAEMNRDTILGAMHVDKKRFAGRLRFSLPVSIGEVKHGVIVEEQDLWKLFSSFMDRI